jgi:NIPSNAP
MKIYEMRTYHFAPQRLPALHKRFEAITLKFWEKYGIQQVGFFTTLIGDSNQSLTYLLKWESLAEREKKWDAFSQDLDWLAKRAETEVDGIIVERIENTILSPTSYSAMK